MIVFFSYPPLCSLIKTPFVAQKPTDFYPKDTSKQNRNNVPRVRIIPNGVRWSLASDFDILV